MLIDIPKTPYGNLQISVTHNHSNFKLHLLDSADPFNLHQKAQQQCIKFI